MIQSGRIRLSRAAGWRMPEGTVRVDRATLWGNPWRVGRGHGAVLLPAAGGPGWEIEALMPGRLGPSAAVHAYRAWLTTSCVLMPAGLNAAGRRRFAERLADRKGLILARLPELRDRPLGCWCSLGAPCHADVLMELADG